MLAERVAVVDRSDRGVLTVSGPDRLSWLHSLTSQHLSALPPLTRAEALVLSPHGHVEHHLVLHDDGETTWVDVEPGTVAALAGYLDSMRFLLRVEVADRSAEMAVLAVLGPDTGSVLGDLTGSELPRTAGAVNGRAGGFVRRTPDDGAELLVVRTELTRLAGTSQPVAGSSAFEALRVASRQPRLGLETDHRTIPHEVGWLGTAVHLDKGCYRGQETVARVHNLGRPPRRLVLLHLDGSAEALPPTGAPVHLDGARVGFVTTAAWHYEQGPIALALVKRTVPDDAELIVGEMAAKIEP